MRGLAAGTLALTIPILVVTFTHLEVFDFARWQAWAWVFLFIASPLSIWRRRLPPSQPRDRYRTASFILGTGAGSRTGGAVPRCSHFPMVGSSARLERVAFCATSVGWPRSGMLERLPRFPGRLVGHPGKMGGGSHPASRASRIRRGCPGRRPSQLRRVRAPYQALELPSRAPGPIRCDDRTRDAGTGGRSRPTMITKRIPELIGSRPSSVPVAQPRAERA